MSADLISAVEFANFVADIVVGKIGTATINLRELKKILKDSNMKI